MTTAVLKACPGCGHPNQHIATNCGHCNRQLNRRQLTTTQRGYGWCDHQQPRKLLLPHAIGRPCPRCGMPMRADQPLDFDHSTPLIAEATGRADRIAHADCNRGGRHAT